MNTHTDNPLVSVIVPVYNGEAFISRCLDSIVNQTYKNIEVIVVNDGSTDSTRFKVERYCSIYSGFICIDKDNNGLEDARKTGVNAAKGKYIQYIDADDTFYDNETISNLVEISELNNADMVVSPFVSCMENGQKVLSMVNDGAMVTGKEHLKLILQDKDYWAVWAKFHLKSLYSGIERIGVALGEDAVLSTQLLLNAGTIVYSSKPAINYYIFSASMSHNRTESFYRDYFKYFGWIEEHLKTLGLYEEFSQELSFHHIRMTANLFAWKRMKETHTEMVRVMQEMHEFPFLFNSLSRREKKLVKAYQFGRVSGRLFLLYYEIKK